MTATQWPAVVDALVELARALPGHRGPADNSDEDLVLVLDGPEFELTGDLAPTFLIVGGALDVDGEGHGESGQAVATLGRHDRDDSGEVRCQVVAQTGGLVLPSDVVTVGRETVKALRDRARAVLDGLDAAVRTDVTLGITARRMVAEIGPRITFRQYQVDGGGAVVSIEFVVAFKSRI